MGKLLLVILALYLVDIEQSIAQEKTTIPLYSYHLKPPLIIDQDLQTGIYYDLTRWLNESSDKYHFDLVFLPRKRLDKMLSEQQFNGVLIGVNPLWFDDKNESKYLWTDKIFIDKDEIVSLKSRPVNYQDPQSLIGKVLGGVRGFYYLGINELVRENQIVRVNTVKEVDLFAMLLNERVDFAVITESTYQYMVNQYHWQDKFFVAATPHSIYSRRLLIPHALNHVYQELAAKIKLLSTDPNWQQQLHRYRGTIDN